ncbi:MAG: hypothetical protein JW982_08605 [Spirochaetes bacterium]|nr:hypothetical protein [Spirochaetota bacterium]
MYYKYKSKKKNNKPLSFLIILVIAGCAAAFLYSRHDTIKFWKYSFSRLEREYNFIISSNSGDKNTQFSDLLKKLQKSYEDNPADLKTIMLLARVNFQLGEIKYDKNFARTIVDDRDFTPGTSASEYFINSIKYFKKILSINEEKIPEDDILIMLSKLYYYMGYYGQDEIFSLLKSVRKPDMIKNDDDKRFYGYMNYIVTNDDKYVTYLKSVENKSSLGKLFLAGVFFKAKQYTDAIMLYKEIIETKIDDKEKLIVQRNLGKIYFYQSLMDESLQFLLPVYSREPDNEEIRQMLVKIYLSKGDKAGAKLYESVKK